MFRRLPLKLLVALLVIISVCFAQRSAQAQPAFDISGEWQLNIFIGSSNYGPQRWTISSLNMSTGQLSGDGEKNGVTWTFSGNLAGSAFSINYQYTSSSYAGTLQGTATGPCAMSGTWDSNVGQTGTWNGVRVGCNPGGGGNLRSSAISLFCNRTGVGLGTAVCSATVADSGAPPRSNPTGAVDFIAGGGFFPGQAQCIPTPTAFSPGISSCSVQFQIPFGFPVGARFPIDALYSGDADFDPAATSHELIQAGCVGTPDAPCVGAVSLSFSDYPQIVPSSIQQIVSCGSRPPRANAGVKQGSSGSPASCAVEVKADLSIGGTLAELRTREEYADLSQKLGSKAYTGSDGILFESVRDVVNDVASNERVEILQEPSASRIEAAVREVRREREARERSSGRLRSAMPEHAASAKPLMLRLGSVKATVKANKQKAVTLQTSKNARRFLTALKGIEMGELDISLRLNSERTGGKIPKGIKRRAKTADSVTAVLR